MTGYQESLTDPSFAGQILTFTAPMIGNYGVEGDVGESDGVQVRALICREARNAQPPGPRGADRLARRGRRAGADGIDTRALVRHLRERGAMRGAVVTDGTPPAEAAERIAAAAADGRPGPGRGRLASASRHARPATTPRARVTVLDYGAKDSIARLLAEAGAARDGAAARRDRGRRARHRSRRHAAGQRPRRPGRHGRARRATCAPCSSSTGRCSASASGTSCWPARSASRRSSCASATAAPTTRCSSRPPAACW